jgi:hypothetical protein
VLSTLLYLPLLAWPEARSLPPQDLVALARVLEKFAAVFLSAGTAVLLLHLLLRVTTDAWAWVLTLVFALGTNHWSTSSQALWQHTPGALVLTASLWFLVRSFEDPGETGPIWLCGLMAGLAVLIRPTNIFLIPSVGAALWNGRAGWRHWVGFLASPAAAAALLASYNLSIFGRLTGGYPGSLHGSLANGLAGVLISPGRGLLLYTPVLLFALLLLHGRCAESRSRLAPMVAACLVFIGTQICIVAAWPVWWGGYCWGPRLLTDTLPFFVLLLGAASPALDNSFVRRAFVAAACWGVLIQAVGSFCYPKGRWDHLPVPVDTDPARLWNWRDNPLLRTAQGGVAWEPYAVVMTAIREGVPAARRRLRELKINEF